MPTAATQNPYGRYGFLNNYVSPEGSGRSQTAPGWTPQGSGLPSYLANRFYYGTTNSGGDGGTDSGAWMRNPNTLDSQGRNIVQVGDPARWGDRTHDWVRDPSQVRYDEDLGYVTDPRNLHDTFYDQSSLSRAAPFIAAFLAGGAGLAAMGAGAAVGGGELAAGGVGTGAFDSGIGLGAMAGGPAAEGIGAGVGVGTGAFDSGIGLETMAGGPNAFAGAGAEAGGGSSLFDTARTGYQTYSRINSIMNLLGGGQPQGGRGSGMPTTNTSGGLGDISSILGLLGLGRSSGLFGGGIGTPGGAQAVGNAAADRADPWGASGGRASFAAGLTPESVMGMLGRGPGGYGEAIQADPAYQFELSQGTQAINMGDAAQGTLRSGNRLTELEAYGTGLASKYQGDYFNRGLASLGALSGLAGAGGMSNPSQAGANMISGFTGASNLQAGGLNGIFSGLGSGALGSGLAALGSGANSIFNRLFGNGGGDGVSSTGDYSIPSGLPEMSGPGAFDGGDPSGFDVFEGGFPWP